MSVPEVIEAEEDEEAEESTESTDVESGDESTSDDDAEVEMVQTSVSETGADPEGFFDDVETDIADEPTGDSIFDSVDESSESSSEETPEAAETRSRGLASDINAGAARLAVLGLDDEGVTNDGKVWKKDDLQDEFLEVFEACRLGHYGSICVEEYLLVETDDIHPVWGLAGAMLICAAVVVFRRPDGDQLIDTTKTKLGQANLSNLKK